jgi:hypothetical protein
MSNDFIPPWMDQATLSKHICASPSTIDNWVAQGILPAPRKRGGKLMWRWAEVDERLTMGTECPDDQATRIRNATRTAATSVRPRY